MIKNIFYSIVLILITNSIFARTGYELLSRHNMYLTCKRNYTKKEILYFKFVFDSIYKMDQECRNKTIEYFEKNAKRVDSLTFNMYKETLEKTGYFSISKDILYKYIANINDFISKYYAIQLHFSDFYAFDLMDLIEKSIYRKTCDEEDLMNYFITYLWRKTEFKKIFYNDINFHIILLPNMRIGTFSKYYKYAYTKYIKYCKYNDKRFSYIRISNIYLLKSNKIIWDKSYVDGVQNKYIESVILNTIKKYKNLVEYIIKLNHPYMFKEGIYEILICTHPKIYGNPNYIH